MLNPKNQLQEFCQKHKSPLPVYHTVKKNSGFSSTVTIVYNENKYHETNDPDFQSKKLAEKQVASCMLKKLDHIIQSETVEYTSRQTIYVLVDMENVHMGNFFHGRKFSKNIRFIGFSTENHPSINVAPPEIYQIETIRSDRKDACDILIIGYATKLSDMDNITIVIITKDHFGPGLVDYICHLNPKCKAISIKHPEGLLDILY
jgi:hypothetical protein